MKVWALVLVLLVSPAMAAPPDIIGQAHWLWAPKPKASHPEPILPPPGEPPLTPYVEPVAVPESWPEPPKVRAVEQGSTNRPKSASRATTRPHKTAVSSPSTSITCAQARQGVGMPCFLIRANAYRYEQLSPAQKRQADACLTAAERAAIRACFH